MSPDYFYFIAGLPNLSFEDTKLNYSLEQFRQDAKAQLSAGAYASLEDLHLPAGIDCLLNVLYKTEAKPVADSLLSPEYWEEFIVFHKEYLSNSNLELPAKFKALPPFINTVIQNALSQEELSPRIQLEGILLNELYQWAEHHGCQFVSKWYTYDAHIRNILTAINGRKFNLPYAKYLNGDGELVEKLAKSHAADFGLGKEDELFESLVRIYEQNNILYRERSYDVLRWRWIDNQNFFNYFNIDRVLGYYCKLRILNRWLKADVNLGKEVFHDTLNAMENSFSFPEEFNIKGIRK